MHKGYYFSLFSNRTVSDESTHLFVIFKLIRCGFTYALGGLIMLAIVCHVYNIILAIITLNNGMFGKITHLK